MKSRLLFFCVMLAIAGAATFDSVKPATLPRPRAQSIAPTAGVLSCPAATSDTGLGYLHLANLGAGPSSLRLRLSPASGRAASATVTLGARAVQTLRLTDRVRGPAGLSLEYSGGEVVASHSLWLPPRSGLGGSAGGAAGASCVRSGAGDVVIAHARTLNASARLVLFNPGGADADISVTLLADGRLLQPERLSRRLVPAGQRRDFRLGDFAFNAHDVTAIVHANAGRVVAECLLSSPLGVELLPAQTPSQHAVAIAGHSGKGTAMSLAVVGGDDAGLDVSIVSSRRQGAASGIPPSLEPSEDRLISIPDQGGARAVAYAINVNVGSPVVAGTSWLVGHKGARDEADLAAVQAASHWAGVLAGFRPRALSRAYIVNTGSAPAHVRIVRAGSRGAAEQTRVIGAGRLLEFSFGYGPGTFALAVDSDVPVGVALSSVAFSSDGTPFLYALDAVPRQLGEGVHLSLDQAAGVSANVEPP